MLSVSERKALFEKNKGAALVPKSPFAMATPIKSAQKKTTITTPQNSRPQTNEVPDNGSRGIGIANKVAALFETQTTISQKQIEDGVKEQRKKEMDLLLNRFHKNDDVSISMASLEWYF